MGKNYSIYFLHLFFMGMVFVLTSRSYFGTLALLAAGYSIFLYSSYEAKYIATSFFKILLIMSIILAIAFSQLSGNDSGPLFIAILCMWFVFVTGYLFLSFGFGFVATRFTPMVKGSYNRMMQMSVIRRRFLFLSIIVLISGFFCYQTWSCRKLVHKLLSQRAVILDRVKNDLPLTSASMQNSFRFENKTMIHAAKGEVRIETTKEGFDIWFHGIPVGKACLEMAFLNPEDPVTPGWSVRTYVDNQEMQYKGNWGPQLLETHCTAIFFRADRNIRYRLERTARPRR